MSAPPTTPPTTPPTNQSGEELHPLRASLYDQVSSWLLACLIATGLSALVLLVIWYSTKEDHRGPKRSQIELLRIPEVEPPAGGSQLEIPTDEPPWASITADAAIRSNLSKLDEAAAKAEQLDDQMLKSGKAIPGFGKGGDVRGDKISDNDIGSATLPRWEIQFDKTSLETYARQLDFFRIELAVPLPDGRLAYAYNLSKPRPDARYVERPHEKEKRYYLTWRRGDLERADRQLLSRAGIDAGDGLILKFLPSEVEARLAALEKGRAAAKSRIIERTRFGVRPGGNGYEFFVLEQTYKPAAPSRP